LAKPFRILQEKMSSEARAESRRKADEILAQMRFQDLEKQKKLEVSDNS
jgi:hypothetical protein